MKDPIKLLRERKDEIFEQYNRLLKMDYNTSGGMTSKQVLEFRESKKADLDKMKELIDSYNEAINCIVGCTNLSL
jgi:hypothetical protein